MVNVGKYTIHGSYGVTNKEFSPQKVASRAPKGEKGEKVFQKAVFFSGEKKCLNLWGV